MLSILTIAFIDLFIDAILLAFGVNINFGVSVLVGFFGGIAGIGLGYLIEKGGSRNGPAL
jgi:hypothetical protein